MQTDEQQSFLGWQESPAGAQACEGVGLVELEGEVLRGLGRCELASHPETESVLRITQGRRGEGKAPQRHQTEEQEGEERGIVLERMVKLDLVSLLWGALQRDLESFPFGGLPFPYLWVLSVQGSLE